MSLPGDVMPNTAQPVAWVSPDSIERGSVLIDYERGGIAIQDPSQGLDVRDWTATLIGNSVRVYPSDDPGDFDVLFTELNITHLSLSFDANMRPAIGYVAAGVAKLYWYDATGGGYLTQGLSTDARSPFLTFDDKRKFSTTTGANDILCFYLVGNGLYYRQQRERFNVERWLADVPSGVQITRAGMNKGLRVQVEMIAR